MWIKICANTNLEDARLAAELGAHAIGFVFAPSSRRVTPADARSIGLALPAAVERIGVFQTEQAGEIIGTVEEGRLTGVQLHGELNLGLIGELEARLPERVTLIQTLHWDTGGDDPLPQEELREKLLEQLAQIRRHSRIRRVLVDSRVGRASGGTGVSFDWKPASRLFEDELGGIELVLAGGLRPENLEEAIRTLQPWGVDVASGVELRPGKKDGAKLESFIRKASLRDELTTRPGQLG